MAIRLRKIDGRWKALCAAKSKLHLDDIYLDDGMHEALSEKFMADFKKMRFIKEEQDAPRTGEDSMDSVCDGTRRPSTDIPFSDGDGKFKGRETDRDMVVDRVKEE